MNDNEQALHDQDMLPLVPGQGEDETDRDHSAGDFHAAVGAKDWTVETLVSQMRKRRIDLDPAFQRRSAWLRNRKSQLIESIILGFPIPQIVLAENRDSPGTYFVIDGKQRLLALRQFFADSSDSKDTTFESFKLTGLDVLDGINGCSLADLEREYPDRVAALENHSIRTVVLSDWSSEDLLLALFLRLNTGSVQLSPQELRQALIPGAFMSWLDKESGEMRSLARLLGNDRPDRRMVDAELLLRHLAFSSSPIAYRGNLKKFLDGSSVEFNKQWDAHSDALIELSRAFSDALDFGMDELGAEAFCRKWTEGTDGQPGRFERALNRAVFDVQVYSFSKSHVRKSLTSKGDELRAKFQLACEKDEEFRSAISSTTKTARAFTVRHETWKKIVNDVAGVDYALPEPLTQSS